MLTNQPTIMHISKVAIENKYRQLSADGKIKFYTIDTRFVGSEGPKTKRKLVLIL